jgi:prepilin-type N-terminal cleavage/methylation domain-containing protein
MKSIKNQKGLTLIELLITISISGVIGLGLVSLQYILSQNQIAITKSYKSVDSANFTVSNLIKEIRMARQSDNGAYLLSLAGNQEIIFYSDIDFDEKTEWVRYYLNGTDLIKEIIKPSGYPAIYDSLKKTSSVVTEGVRNGTTSIFYYYNQNWPYDTINNPLAADDRLSETKTIKIYLRANVENRPERDYVIESFSQIRSVK